MKKQQEMVDSFIKTHRLFTENLTLSINMIDKEISDAKEMNKICTDEWCSHIEMMIDELAKFVYSIHEPRWTTNEESKNLSNLRHKIHDLYSKYKSIKT